VGDNGVLGLNPLELLRESRVDFFNELGGEKLVRAGERSVDGLEQVDDLTGLLLLNPLSSGKRTIELGQAVDDRVDERVNGTAALEPGGHGELLPKGSVGVCAVDEERDGSSTD
ncbi:unnamed protein product, partial [Allacma fusca]